MGINIQGFWRRIIIQQNQKNGNFIHLFQKLKKWMFKTYSDVLYEKCTYIFSVAVYRNNYEKITEKNIGFFFRSRADSANVNFEIINFRVFCEKCHKKG